MRDNDGYISQVDTPEEFIELFNENTWEFDYISNRTIDLLMGWIKEYIKIKEVSNDNSIGS